MSVTENLYLYGHRVLTSEDLLLSLPCVDNHAICDDKWKLKSPTKIEITVNQI